MRLRREFDDDQSFRPPVTLGYVDRAAADDIAAAVLRHDIVKTGEPEVVAAEAVTVRELIDGPGTLAEALG